ncbi:uncharacterized protein HD556DRAFT_1312799 [Suillus plorans]|uniref:Uncharacterized protein n=1 Tax=Suillus plorans TaxID=116603 RepID=A0A9P7ADU6_9AGAM|nr:uncharacterized protein HD556DRAFT_1312799 [Suillus plorans]KAG1787337.1 hypothetical protein HD556DRAFT_1312799 [Suillus plorans]
MSSDYSSDNSSRPSDFNDGAEAILMNTDFGFEDHSGRSTPESHIGCPGYGHGQGGPVYSCGCYKHNLNGFARFQSEPSSLDTQQACQLADAKFRAAHPKLLGAHGDDHNNDDSGGSGSKRKWSEDDGDVTNMRATSVPIVELPPEKRTRIEGKFESFEGESPALAKIMQEVERMRDTCRVSSLATQFKVCDFPQHPKQRKKWMISCFGGIGHHLRSIMRLRLKQTSPHVEIADIGFLKKPIPGLQTFIRDMAHYTLSPVRLKASKIGGGSPDLYVSINDREELARTKHKLSMLACRTDWDFSVQARCCEFNESSLLGTASDICQFFG